MRPFDDDDMPVRADEYADVALMMAAVREWPSEQFARELDARVARRFVPLAPAATHETLKASRGRRWLSLPALGGAGGLVVAAGVAVAVIATSGGSSVSDFNTRAPLTTVGQAITTSQATSGSSGRAGTSSAGVPTLALPAATSYSSKAYTGSAGVTGSAAVPSPNAGAGAGAKQIESAQISLNVGNDHIDQVSQEVFNVVADEHGYVGSSRITAATRNSGGGYAFFTLSIPTSNLQAAMTQLSRLRYASVSSRTDASQNVGGQYSRDQRRLRDAQALRVSLLKQLQTAASQTAIDSIEAQLKTAERQISNAQSTLHSLQHQIGYSNVSVQINSDGLPIIPVVAKSHRFTIARAGHDAVRVLIVAAGVALIALAVMVPVGLVIALIAWIGVALRQRRRERALDAG